MISGFGWSIDVLRIANTHYSIVICTKYITKIHNMQMHKLRWCSAQMALTASLCLPDLQALSDANEAEKDWCSVYFHHTG